MCTCLENSEIQRKRREKSGRTSSKAIVKGMFPFQRVFHCGAWWPIDLHGLSIRWSRSDLHGLPIWWFRSVEKPGHSEPGGLNLPHRPLLLHSCLPFKRKIMWCIMCICTWRETCDLLSFLRVRHDASPDVYLAYQSPLNEVPSTLNRVRAEGSAEPK